MGKNGEKEPKPFQNTFQDNIDVFQLSTGWTKQHSQKIAGNSNDRLQYVVDRVSTADIVWKKHV